jgi:hypothetical protein
MASYRGHIAFSTILGAGYGAAGFWFLGIDLIPAVLAGGLTAVSGLLPDLDSDSGVPVRALFGLASIVLPLLALPRLLAGQLGLPEIVVALVLIHVLVRYVLAGCFKRVTVHRGMFHSIPAMGIAGLGVFLLYHHPEVMVRAFMAGGAMVGFLSHLVLDELCSVDLVGARVRLNKYAGSALKFVSPSWGATLGTYALLAGLAYLTAMQFPGPREKLRHWHAQPLNIGGARSER